MLSYISCVMAFWGSILVTHLDSVTVSSNHLRIADVADLTDLDETSRKFISNKVIASQSGNEKDIYLKRSSIAELIRKRVPGLSPIVPEGSSDEIRIKFIPQTNEYVEGGAKCYVFNREVSAGQAITKEDLQLNQCDKTRTLASMRYDKVTGVLRAVVPISVQSYAGQISVPDSAFVDVGDEIVVSVVIGPVRIEKDVWALQPANEAEFIFVRDKNGQIMRVPLKKQIFSQGGR